MTEPRKPRGPLIIDLEQTPLPEAPSPAQAPPPDMPPATGAVLAAATRPRRWGLGGVLLGLLVSLGTLWLGVAAVDFVSALFARHAWLGWFGTGLLGAVVIGLSVVALREVAALARLGRVEGLRTLAERAVRDGDRGSAEMALDGVAALYARRPDLIAARADIAAAAGDTPDPVARLELAERAWFTPLDKAAADVVSRASRDVAAATALIPLALVDVLAALVVNLRMVREIAELYGGRAGWLGSWRLMRAVAGHLVATGAVAVTDDVLGPTIGGGILGKLSRRFGEGVINGALTARVGVAAIEICRPMAFRALERPSPTGLLVTALRNWRAEGKND